MGRPMRNLLLVMGIVETGTGLALLAAPSLVASILLGLPLEGTVGSIVGRVGGAALLSLGVACLLARGAAATDAPSGIITAMLIYNTAATALLVYCRLGLGMTSMVLWPAIVLHAALAVWCIASLRGGRAPDAA